MKVIDLIKVIKDPQNIVIVNETTYEYHQYDYSHNDKIIKSFEATSDFNGIITYQIYIQ